MGWKYYNHAFIPDCAPHECALTSCIEDKSIWKTNRNALLARWTSDYDCTNETSWWYIVKDTPFDIRSLKSKRRYEINKGNKHFEVRRLLEPLKYAEQLCDVQISAFSAYPIKYRPSVHREKFIEAVNNWDKNGYCVYGAFSCEDQSLCGYAYLVDKQSYLEFNVLKTCPGYERYGINAAIIYKILQDFENRLDGEFYICDGARSISHETAFQDYLEKYFGFRKAYCRLHIAYRPKVKVVIKCLYPFRKILRHFDGIGMVHQVNAVLRMEEICRREEVG